MDLVQYSPLNQIPASWCLCYCGHTDPVSGSRHQLGKTEEEEKTASSDSRP